MSESLLELPAGTVTFLFTDIEGSTSLWERSPHAMRSALSRHNALLQTTISQHAGYIFQIVGDAFHAAFSFPIQAVEAALAVQRALDQEPWAETGPLRVRMGIHTGPAEIQEGNYLSNHTLNRVARVMSAGHGGQILISAAVAELIREHLSKDMELEDLGKHRLKGLSQPEHLYQVVVPDLASHFPALLTQTPSTPDDHKKSETPELLSTKLTIPQSLASRVTRESLLRRLDVSLEHKVTLVSAPAGFGKTTLVSEWLLQSGWRTTWLSLDEEDSDPNRFWTYFISALRVLREDLGESAQAILDARAPLVPQDESFLTVLLNEIATFSEPIVLVLDDYHLINNLAIHNDFTFLIDHLPGQMHLILASRSDPPLPLARWRARSQLTEIRADDLRFTEEESSTFLVEILGLPISKDEVGALVNRTEGWIAALQLAALSMPGRQKISNFITELTGSHHYIFDYLSEEILQRQPETVRLFLLRTSILDHLCGPLCEAVTGQSGSQEMLENLERANLFLQPLDDERRWYRYHQLFAEVLRHHLRQAQPNLIPELHRRASKWFADNGLASEAIRHALVIRDFEWAADLVEANAIFTHWRQGDNVTLLKWLEELPDEIIRRRPRLCLSHAWALLISGKSAAAESRLEDLEKLLAQMPGSGIRVVDGKGLRGQMAAIRASLARNQNDLPRAIELCRQALQELPSENISLRAVISLNLGLAHWQDGDISAAGHVLGEMSMIDEQGRILLTSLAGQAFLADMQAEQGRLHQAVRIYKQTIERATLDHGRPSPVATWAYIGMGKVLLQWNDLDSSGSYLEKGLELARQWGNADGLAWSFLCLAEWKLALGLLEEADQALLQAEQVTRQRQVVPLTESRVASFRGRLWISQGMFAEAGLWAQERGLTAENNVNYQRLPEYLSFARLIVARGTSEARSVGSLLGRMSRLTESLGLTTRLIEVLLLQASMFLAQGDTRQAEELLEQAVTLAEPEHFIRLFLDEDRQMKRLIKKCVLRQSSKPPSGGYAFPPSLLAALAHSEGGQRRIQGSASESRALVEPLSEREMEILRLLAEGLSNREIAQRSYISIGTVKAHLKHIYAKLEVGNRTEAANRARQLSLI